MKKYLIDDRQEFSKVPGLASTVLITQEKTLTSYLTDVNRYMQAISDDGILSLTSEHELDISKMDEQPNAVFVIVPDERFTRHKFVTLFMSQAYKELVEKARTNQNNGETKEMTLKRNTYLIMDEFGNIPKIEKLDGKTIYAGKVKVCLREGEPAFKEAIEALKQTEPMNPLFLKQNIIIPVPDDEDAAKQPATLKGLVENAKAQGKRVDGSFKDSVKDYYTSVLLLIIDDTGKNKGKKRKTERISSITGCGRLR